MMRPGLAFAVTVFGLAGLIGTAIVSSPITAQAALDVRFSDAPEAQRALLDENAALRSRVGKAGPSISRAEALSVHPPPTRRSSQKGGHADQTRTNGAVNFTQTCAHWANTVDLHLLLLSADLANFAQIRLISRKFG